MPPAPIITDSAAGAPISRRPHTCAKRRLARRRGAVRRGGLEVTRVLALDAATGSLLGRAFVRRRCGRPVRRSGQGPSAAAPGHDRGIDGHRPSILVHARWHRREHRSRRVHRCEDRRVGRAGPGVRRRPRPWHRSRRWKPLRCRSSRSVPDRAIACLDARMGEVYWGCFAADAAQGLIALGASCVGTS